jgi:branched-chain amino acid transport system ATP-binding protein
MNDTSLLRVDSLHAGYGPARILTGIDFSIDRGSIVAILGANGAGKTTLARAVAGLISTTAGTVTFDGEDITAWKAERRARAGLVYLPEGRGIFADLSVGENLAMAVIRMPRTERDPAVGRALELFPALAKRTRQRAGTLSGGEQQMLSLARGLVVRPVLVIADELSLGLAPQMVDVVFESLAKAAAMGVTVIMIEQFIHRALGLANACAIVRRGQIAWSGPTSDAGTQVLEHYLGEPAS